MCGVTRKDKIKNEHIQRTTTIASKCGETIELVWTCDEDIKKKIGQPQARWKDAWSTIINSEINVETCLPVSMTGDLT